MTEWCEAEKDKVAHKDIKYICVTRIKTMKVKITIQARRTCQMGKLFVTLNINNINN
jgi:hypothetical protein